MKYISTFLSLMYAGMLIGAQHKLELRRSAAPKSILIFSSIGGGGHTAATQAIQEYCGKDTNIQVVQPLSEILPMGPYENWYNGILQKGLSRLGNMYAVIGHISSYSASRYIDKKFNAYLGKLCATGKRPDLIVSVMPFINGSLVRAARAYDIPCVLIAVDLDIQNYFPGFNGASDLCTICLPHTACTPQTVQKIRTHAIPQTNIVTTSFLLRKQYDAYYDKQEMRETHLGKKSIHNFVVMILMGAAGSDKTLTFLESIVHSLNPSRDMTIIVCCGKNDLLAQRAAALQFTNPKISLKIQKFTSELSPLMAASDLMITKPGPTSLHEAISTQTPVILDNTTAPLNWEKRAIDLVRQEKIGHILNDMRDLPKLLQHCINNKKDFRALKRNICHVKNNLQDPKDHVAHIIQKALVP